MGSEVVSFEDEDFARSEAEAEMLLETTGGELMGEGIEGPSRIGHDPWVLTAVDGTSFSISSGIKRKKLLVNYHVANFKHTL